MKQRMMTALTAVLLLAVAACNTTEGVGKDVQSGGEVLSDTARDVKKKL
ncbi:MAG: entericidin A/B family lipoprotein [Defluviicoccus sp.]